MKGKELTNTERYDRRTCPGGFDYAGHVCDDSGCPDGYPRLTATGWQVSAPVGQVPRLEGDTLIYDWRNKRP